MHKKPRQRLEKTYLFVIPAALLIMSLFFGSSIIAYDTARDITTTVLPVVVPEEDSDAPQNSANKQIALTTPPALTALNTLLNYEPSGMSRPTINKGGTPDNALSWICGYEITPAPVAGGEASFNAEKMSVTIQVVGAGQAAKALTSARQSVQECDNRDGYGGMYTAGSPVLGTAGFIGYSRVKNKTTIVSIWQRGDVILSVAGTSFTKVQELVGQYDKQARDILDGICLSLDAELKDAQRSPYYSPDDYTGWNKGRKVEVSTRTPGLHPGLLSASSDVESSGYPLGNVRRKLQLPINGEEGDVPSWNLVTIPDAPLPPYEGKLPKAVSMPTPAPTFSAKRPTSIVVPERIRDLEGPGCGWAFTGQSSPLWDDELEKERADKEESTAQKKLRNEYKEYLVERARYLGEWSRYYDEVMEYREYARQVRAVGKQWKQLNKKRAAYREILDEYWDSVRANEKFESDQKKARKEYKEEIRLCKAEAEEREVERKRAAEKEKQRLEEEERKRAEEEANADDEPTDGEESPEPTEEPTEEPEAPEEPKTESSRQCPPEEPSILEEDAPDILPVPALPDFPLPDAWKSLIPED